MLGTILKCTASIAIEIAVGNPTILTATAHGFCNGDVVAIAALTGADAALLKGQSLPLLYKTANGFAVAVDTTGKTITAGAGTAIPQTYTAIANVHDFSAFDGTVTEIDVTNFASTAKEFIAGLVDNGMFPANMNAGLSDPGQVALLAAKVGALVKAFKLILPNGKTASFNGFVKKFGGASCGGVDAVVKVGCDSRISGPVTWA